ncbi:putative pyruvate, phosphate dikinase regulatory protein [uncultured Gammaproteobacteria bacterium]
MTNEMHFHLISDATGETVSSMARACLIQFERISPVLHSWKLVKTKRQLEIVIEEIRETPGTVIFTLVGDELRKMLEDFCREQQIPCIAILDPLIDALSGVIGSSSRKEPGRQHTLDAEYFDRMDAMDFALVHDDGQSVWSLHEADVILVGVSRSSKTPTCLYLANQGIKAANIPFVPKCPLPPELDQVTGPLIVGLTNDPDRLVQVRRTRLRLLKDANEMDYVDLEVVRSEVVEARRFFNRRGWPVIDVSRRSIEETAAEIVMLLTERRQTKRHNLASISSTVDPNS